MPKEPKILGLFFNEDVTVGGVGGDSWVVSYKDSKRLVPNAWTYVPLALEALCDDDTHHSRWFPNPQLVIPGELL